MDPVELENRFVYHAPSPVKAELHEDIRGRCGDLALVLNTWVPEGREKSLAVTHLEEVMMWANAAIARTPDDAFFRKPKA